MSLKAANLGWLWAVAALDAIIAIFIADPNALASFKANDFVWIRGVVVGAAPVAVLLICSLLSSDAKAALVFWRVKHVLPGHRAFTVHAPMDSRIDMGSLRKNVGAWPDDAAGQNTMWFKLYKKVENDVAVVQAHKGYLLFRDLAALSLLLAPVALAAVLFSEGTTWRQAIGVAGVFLVQYGAALIAARHSGNRMVTNVLSAHSVKRRTA